MKRVCWILFFVLAGGALFAGALEQAQRLSSLGFYQGAETLFRQVSPPTPESQRGLLQTLLAQNKPEAARELLASPAAVGLQKDGRALYEALVALELGEPFPKLDFDDDALLPEEKTFAGYIRGLEAFVRADYDDALKYWRDLPPETLPALWSAALLPGGETSEKNLEKKVQKLRRADYPLVKYFVLGALARGAPEQARELLKKNALHLTPAQEALLGALTYPEKTPERSEALIKALAASDDPKLLTVAVMLAQKETVINLRDVETQLKTKDAVVALILAQAWQERGAFARAWELLAAARAEKIPEVYREAFYSTQALLAESQTPPRYREAADALIKWRELSGTSPELSGILQRRIGDAYFKNGDYADAAAAYRKALPSCARAAVLAHLKAGAPEAARELLQENFDGWGDALLAYLFDQREKGRDVEALALEFNERLGGLGLTGIDYLRVDALAEKEPEKAVARIDGILASLPRENALWRAFELKKYRLLVRLRRMDEASALLQKVLAEEKPPREFVLLALERALAEGRARDSWELLEKVGSLPPAERLDIQFLIADLSGNTPEILARLQKEIEVLPANERFGKMLLLARRFAAAGALEKALELQEALAESSIEGAKRDETDFLHAMILELSGDAAAEAAYVALSQREARALSLRASAALAAYYARKGLREQARAVFYDKLAELAKGTLPEELRPWRGEIFKALNAVLGALNEPDAKVLAGELENWRSPETDLSSAAAPERIAP